MSLWYDIKKKSYASDAKDNWIKSYVDKLVLELKNKINATLERHYIGQEGGHKAEDVVCNDGTSVQTAIEQEAIERLSSFAAIRQEMNTGDLAVRNEVIEERTARMEAERNLRADIDAEAQTRADALEQKVDKEAGMGLSENNYTRAEKEKLSLIEEGAEKNVVISVSGKTGAVNLAKEDVGLSNVDNTSDADKPISTATQAALDDKADLEYVDEALGYKADLSVVITKTNKNAFTPTENYQPATKKYVDDSVSAAGGGDMLKSVYDQDNDGVVDNAEKLGGQLPSYYATKAEVDAKASMSHASPDTIYGVGNSSDYGHLKLANNLTTTTETGVALSAYQGKVLKDKIAELNMRPELTTVSPDGTKIGEPEWTGTGWVCTKTDTKYTFNNTYITIVSGFNRFCLKFANDYGEWKNWTPFFEYEGQLYEFFYSPSRGLYEALIPANNMTAGEVVSAIEWKKIPPTILNYGKVANGFGHYETVTTATDGTTTSEHSYFIRREIECRDTSGMIGQEDVYAQQGLAVGKYYLATGDIDVNSAAIMVLAADINMNGALNGSAVTRSVMKGNIKNFNVETIDNFS